MKTLTINGNNLSLYRIIYTQNESLVGVYSRDSEVDAAGKPINPKVFYRGQAVFDAAHLRDAVVANYGVSLPIASDSAAESPYEILLAGTTRPESQLTADLPAVAPMHCILAVRGNKLVVYHNDNPTMRRSGLALARFFTEYDSLTLKDGELYDISCMDIDVFPRAEGTNLRVVTTNIAATYNWGGYSEIALAERKNIFLAEIAALDPDVAAVQEVDERWHEVLAELTDYAVVCPTLTILDGKLVNNLTTLIYKKSKFNEIASGLRPFDTCYDENGVLTKNGYIRNMTWVVLEDKQTGARALFTNSHWDWKKEPFTDKEDGTTYAVYQDFQGKQYGVWTRELATTYACPAFGMADYNCHDLTANSFANYLRHGGLTNLRDVALANRCMLNNYGSTHHAFQYHILEPLVACDHIVYNRDPRVTLLAYRTIVENAEMDLSDHVPRYVDVILTK